MRAREFIFEAAYDSMIAAIKRQFPDQISYIDQWVKWAKTALKKADRVIWFLKIVRADLEKELSPKELGNYQFSNIQQLATDIHHFYGIDYAPIQNYVYKDQPVGQVIADLSRFESTWQKEQETNRGVEVQEGDYLLFEFNDGTAWWWVNRAYCSDEGRSGGHCGNVVGQHKPDQRILSLRNKQNQVICTFILEPDGTLGEMKAKNNQKPSSKYHPQILKLLMWDRITGIAPTTGQYNPSANFNVFDLNEKQLVYVDQTKPELIASQIQSNPVSALNMPDSFKQKYQKITAQANPEVGKLLFNATDSDWSNAIEQDPTLIIHAPTTIDNWRRRAVSIIAYNPYLLYQAPAHIGKNYEILNDIINLEPARIGEVNPNISGYEDLSIAAVKKDVNALQYIPEPQRTKEVCEVAVSKDAYAFRWVPEPVQTEEMQIAAVKYRVDYIDYIPNPSRRVRLYHLASVFNDSHAYLGDARNKEEHELLTNPPEDFQKIMLDMKSTALKFADPNSLTKDTLSTIMTDNDFYPIRDRFAQAWDQAYSAIQYYNIHKRSIDASMAASEAVWKTLTRDSLTRDYVAQIEEYYKTIISPVMEAIRRFRKEGSEDQHQEIVKRLRDFRIQWRERLEDWLD